jgi:hypothetical protein
MRGRHLNESSYQSIRSPLTKGGLLLSGGGGGGGDRYRTFSSSKKKRSGSGEVDSAGTFPVLNRSVENSQRFFCL